MAFGSCKPWAVRALAQRLEGGELPAWASYLPPKLRQTSFQSKFQCGIGVATDSCHYAKIGSGITLLEGHITASSGLETGCAASQYCAHAQKSRVSNNGLAIDPSIPGRVWELSQQSIGCREVQRALDCLQTEADKAQLASELRGHVLEALVCPYANHVLQKCITSLRPFDLQFVFDELTSVSGALERAAMHRYGCRIVQRLLENCLSSQVEGVAELLVSKAELLMQHAYGNYVIQSLIQNGTMLMKRKLVQLLVELPLLDVCLNVCSRAVVKAALREAAEDDALLLSRNIIQTPGLMARLAREKCSILKLLKGMNLTKQSKSILRA